MEVHVRTGVGTSDVAIVAGIHGDEPAGVNAVRRLAAELSAPDESVAPEGGTVTLIVANEPALEAGTRYTDVDLNRAFPGESEANKYERVLAFRLAAALTEMDAVLSIHSSYSVPPPFAIYTSLTPTVRQTVAGLPVEYALDVAPLDPASLETAVPNTVTVEVGPQGSEMADEGAYEAALAFLRTHNAIEDRPPAVTSTTVVKAVKRVPKGDGKPRLHYRNFEPIPEGAVFASDDVYTHRTTEPNLVPVLASERGYPDIFGLYGRIDGTISSGIDETEDGEIADITAEPNDGGVGPSATDR